MSARKPIVAEMLGDDEVLVRGTLDVEEAWAHARVLLAKEEYGADALEHLDDIARRREHPGWYRKVHCLPSSYGHGEGWTWQLMPAVAGARGAFPAVTFSDLLEQRP